MKKVTCGHCAKKWYLDEDLLDQVQTCPFCSRPVREKVEITSADSLDKAIYLTIRTIGQSALENPSRIGGCLYDMAPQLRREIRILSRSLPEEYFSFVRKAWTAELPEAERLLKMMEKRLMEEEGLTENWTGQIRQAYFGAIRYSRGIGLKETLLLKVEDCRVAAPASPPSDFEFSGGTLLRYSGTDRVVTIPSYVPSAVTVINNCAFEKNAHMEKVIIPGSVTFIQDFAFTGCSRLREVEVQQGVKSIGRRAFALCRTLESVSLAATVTDISSEAFYGCTNLKEMTLMGAQHFWLIGRFRALQDVYTSASLAVRFQSEAKKANVRLHII